MVQHKDGSYTIPRVLAVLATVACMKISVYVIV